MNNQEFIMKTQNSEEMLKCQYAARFYYNRAEITCIFAWILSIVASLLIFIPDSLNHYIPAIIINLLAFVCQKKFPSYVATAALLRNYFDSVVLNIIPNQFSESEIVQIREIANNTSSRFNKKYQVQIQNTGHSTPPGVKNWYDLSLDSSTSNAAFECQKMNNWWTKHQRTKRINLTLSIVFLLAVIILLIMLNIKVSLFNILVCCISLFINLYNLAKEHYNYYNLSLSINAIINLPDLPFSEPQLQHLQEQICTLRKIPVLEINAIHKKYSKYWSNLYKNCNY